jgi:hypothetical protein
LLARLRSALIKVIIEPLGLLRSELIDCPLLGSLGLRGIILLGGAVSRKVSIDEGLEERIGAIVLALGRQDSTENGRSIAAAEAGFVRREQFLAPGAIALRLAGGRQALNCIQIVGIAGVKFFQ